MWGLKAATEKKNINKHLNNKKLFYRDPVEAHTHTHPTHRLAKNAIRERLTVQDTGGNGIDAWNKR